VSAERLVDLLWDGEAPEHARRSVQVLVARLRAWLPLEPDESLEAGRGGYALHVDPDAVDVHRFCALVAAARTSGSLDERADLLRRAVGLWRGRFMQASATDALRERISAPLETQRLDATEDLLATELALGREQELLPMLARLTAEHPGRERFAELHMQALHRLGRDVEALAVYRVTRLYLADELGLEPSPRLQALHIAILRQDPTDTHADPSASPAVPRPAGLPAAVSGFAGRRSETQQLAQALEHADGPRVVAIVGTGGVGKTALCVHFGHQVRSRFPDGQLYINMHGYSSSSRPVDPHDALSRFLRALDVPDERIPPDLDEAATTYRSALAERRMLVVLDNVRDPDQARPLLPANPGCFTLITSRDNLDALLATEGIHRLDLDVLPRTDAIALLTGVLGEARVDAEPAAAADLATECAGLPLALRITAAQLAARPMRLLAQHVHDIRHGDRLDALSIREDPNTSVAATLDLSYQTLPDHAARFYRLFGITPAPDLDAWGLAALTNTTVTEAERTAEILLAAHLISEVSPGRYGLHDLVRLHASRHALTTDTPDDREQALIRLAEWYIDTAFTAYVTMSPASWPPPWSRLLQPINARQFADAADALEWFDREHVALVALARHAADAGINHVVCPLIHSQGYFMHRRHAVATMVDLYRLSWDVATVRDDLRDLGASSQGLSIAYYLMGHVDDAVHWNGKALATYEKLGRDDLMAVTHLNLGTIYGSANRYDLAAPHCEIGLELARRAGDDAGESLALTNLGHCYMEMERWDLALQTTAAGIEVQRRIGDRTGESLSENTFGLIFIRLEQYEKALGHLTAALAISEELGDRLNAPRNVMVMGDAFHGLGDTDRARDLWQSALDQFRAIDSPEAAEAERRLRGEAPSD
jgi:DNA-binding SARP family transcriptional activator/tetratricopeptide (TPR) repeat protein